MRIVIKNRFGRIAEITFYTLFVLVYLFSSHNTPLYLDEVNSQILNNRFLLDEFNLISLFSSCLTNLSTVPPIEWWPVLIVKGLVHLLASSAYYVKVFGLIAGSLIFIELYFIISYQTDRRWLLFSAFIGSFPFLLFLNRAEQDLIIGLLSILLLQLHIVRFRDEPKARVLQFLIFYFFLYWGVTAHPKGIVLYLFSIPLILSFMNLRSKIFTATIFALGFYRSFVYCFNRFSCPGNEILESYFSKWLLIKPSDPVNLIFSFADNFKSFVYQYTNLFIENSYQFNWIPGYSLNTALILNLSNIMIVSSILFLNLLALSLFIINMFRIQQVLACKLLMSGMITFVTAYLLIFAQNEKFFYFITFHHILMIISVVFMSDGKALAYEKILKIGFPLFFSVSLVSSLLTLIYYDKKETFDPASRILQYRTVPAYIPAQLPEVEESVARLAKICDFNDSNDRILIDNLTYWPLRKFKFPLHIGGLAPSYLSPQELGKYLDQSRASGFILHTISLPNGIPDGADCINDLCCVKSRPD